MLENASDVTVKYKAISGLLSANFSLIISYDGTVSWIKHFTNGTYGPDLVKKVLDNTVNT